MRALARLCAAASLLVAASGALACGDPTSSAPPVEVVETAESIATPVTFSAPYDPTPESGEPTKEPLILNGRIFGSGPVGVILAHMRPADQTSWFPYAQVLAAAGGFTVLTFDFRGYGDSTGEKQFDRVDTDLDAAFSYLRDDRGIEKIFLVGASMGGTASLVVSASLPVAGVVSISSPSDFRYLEAVEPVKLITAPKLFISSADDVPAIRSQEMLFEAATEPKEQHIYEGDAHGTALFDGPHAADITSRLTAFLRNN